MSSREYTTRLPESFTPLQRILLTANGNVQSIISAFYNTTVTVEIKKNDQINSEDNALAIFDRSVDILVLGRVCCHADSLVEIHSKKALELVVNDKVGIGQLFRYTNTLPEFDLIDCGLEHDVFWRKYTLKSEHLTCFIRETFPINVFEFKSL